MPASRTDLLRPMPSLTEVRNRTPAADEELRCIVEPPCEKALLRLIEPGVALTDHLTGVQSVRESSPAECSWPFPSRRILLELRPRPRRYYLCRRVDWARRCTPRPDQVSSLSLPMGLTTILTTIWV